MKQAGALGRIVAAVARAWAGLRAAGGAARETRPAAGVAAAAAAPTVPEAATPGSPSGSAGDPPAAEAPPASSAATPLAYRRDAAGHMYRLHPERIWRGRLPPMLHAVGVLEVDLDASGRPRRLNWLRAPRHAPEVMAEIERMVQAAAPFPLPLRLGRVTWTDTWLWHESGRFQLDTLTEGQD